MKKILLSFCLFLSFYNMSLAQDCNSYGKRTLIVLDNDIRIKVPTTSHDSIALYIKLLQIPGALFDYLSKSDPTSSCIQPSYLSAAKGIDTSFVQTSPTLFSLVTGNLSFPSAGDSSSDYLITGSIIQETSGGYVVSLMLETGRTHEQVKTVSSTFSTGFDPHAVAAAAAQQIGPAFNAMTDYEKNKRATGEPYAIAPTIVIKPSKTVLDLKEVTSVHITMTDCDGTPLNDRTIAFTAQGGTLDQTSVRTDNQGTADILYTAGSTPTIGVIQGTCSYVTPLGEGASVEIEPAGIQIKKPDDAWYAEGHYTFTQHTNERRQSDYESNDNQENIRQTVFFAAWVKPYPGVPLNQFQCDHPPVSLVFSATRDDLQEQIISRHNSAGGADIHYHYFAGAKAERTANPELGLAIYKNSYAFHLTQIKCQQWGSSISTEDNYDIMSGSHHYVTVGSPDPETSLSGNVQDVSRDTTYTTIETVPELGQTTRTVVTQTFSWQNSVCRLDYQQHMTEEVHTEFLSERNDETTNWDWTAKIYLYFNGTPTGIEKGQATEIPRTFSLEQNYPNPFNPSTTIHYELPKASTVSLKIFNALGQLVTTLVDEKKEPGYYAVRWKANVPSGIYFYRLQAGGYVETKKMILAK